jgi:hypothetical protein
MARHSRRRQKISNFVLRGVSRLSVQAQERAMIALEKDGEFRRRLKSLLEPVSDSALEEQQYVLVNGGD